MEEFTYNWEGEILTPEFLAAFPVGGNRIAAIRFVFELFMHGPAVGREVLNRIMAWAASL